MAKKLQRAALTSADLERVNSETVACLVGPFKSRLAYTLVEILEMLHEQYVAEKSGSDAESHRSIIEWVAILALKVFENDPSQSARVNLILTRLGYDPLHYVGVRLDLYELLNDAERTRIEWMDWEDLPFEHDRIAAEPDPFEYLWVTLLLNNFPAFQEAYAAYNESGEEGATDLAEESTQRAIREVAKNEDDTSDPDWDEAYEYFQLMNDARIRSELVRRGCLIRSPKKRRH